jgi:XisI protein
MDRTDEYRLIVERIIKDYASIKSAYGQIETEAIIDRENDHYEVVDVGWDNKSRRVHGTVIHLDIIGGKVWIQYDGTDRPVADELLAAGIPPEDIVLAFHPPRLRHLTGFAVGVTSDDQAPAGREPSLKS